MADIIKLGKNEWVWVRLNWFESGRSESVFEWIWKKITRCPNSRWQWLNPQRQNSRWLQSSSWFRMYEWSVFVQNSWIQDSRIQDGCHYKVEWEWISLSQSFVQNCWIQDGRIQDGCHHHINQIELVWIRVRVEWECFWVNLREDNKVFDSKMAVSESKMADFKMAAISKLSQNEWVKFFLCANGGNQSWQVWVSLRGNTKMAESKLAKFMMAEFKMAAITKLSENEWVWVRLN